LRATIVYGDKSADGDDMTIKRALVFSILMAATAAAGGRASAGASLHPRG